MHCVGLVCEPLHVGNAAAWDSYHSSGTFLEPVTALIALNAWPDGSTACQAKGFPQEMHTQPMMLLLVVRSETTW